MGKQKREKKDMSVVWRDDFLTGHESIDEQHKEMVKMANEFYTEVQAGGVMARVYFIKAIQSSVQYIKTLFMLEEDLMQRGKYPFFKEHKAQHENFVAEVFRQVHDIETEGTPDPSNFARFLLDWISHHISDSDKKLAPFYAGLG